MKKILTGLSLLTLILGLNTCARAADLPWITSYKQAVRKAKQGKKILMVDFTAVW